jgi:hypothetical protein
MKYNISLFEENGIFRVIFFQIGESSIISFATYNNSYIIEVHKTESSLLLYK